jgi:hypothetical protein
MSPELLELSLPFSDVPVPPLLPPKQAVSENAVRTAKAKNANRRSIFEHKPLTKCFIKHPYPLSAENCKGHYTLWKCTVYTIETTLSPSRFFDIAGASTGDGAALQTFSAN